MHAEQWNPPAMPLCYLNNQKSITTQNQNNLLRFSFLRTCHFMEDALPFQGWLLINYNYLVQKLGRISISDDATAQKTSNGTCLSRTYLGESYVTDI